MDLTVCELESQRQVFIKANVLDRFKNMKNQNHNFITHERKIKEPIRNAVFPLLYIFSGLYSSLKYEGDKGEEEKLTTLIDSLTIN